MSAHKTGFFFLMGLFYDKEVGFYVGIFDIYFGIRYICQKNDRDI